MVETAQQLTRVETLADDINGRRYPDVTAVALLQLLSTERLCGRRGYKNVRHWGHGPHHRELAYLGLVTIGEPEFPGGSCPVELTVAGRDVAQLVEKKRTRGDD